MSTTIDYRRKAYVYDEPYGGQGYVVLAETGDSNLINMQTGECSRHWGILFHGPGYAVYREVAGYCSWVSGGSLRIMGHRKRGDYATDIMAAIRLYDRTLKAAQPLERLFEEHSLTAVLDVTGPVTNGYAEERLAKYLTQYGLALQETPYYGKLIQRAQIAIRSVLHLRETLDGRHWGDPHIHVRV